MKAQTLAASHLLVGSAITQVMANSEKYPQPEIPEIASMTYSTPNDNNLVFPITCASDTPSVGFWGQERKPTRVEKIAFPRDQRKRRKQESQNRKKANTKKPSQLFNRCR